MNLSGLMFDMDGLLFSTEEVYYEATKKAADDQQLPFSREDYIQYFLGIDEEEIIDVYKNYFQFQSQKEVEDFLQKAFQYGTEQINAGDVEVKPGALSLLNWAKEKEIPCVIISNNRRKPIEELLASHQLRPYFKEIFSTEDVKKGKPDPELFFKAVDFLKVDKKECIMLEDSFLGLQGSVAAGIPGYLVPDMLQPTPEMKAIATKVFPSLTDVLTYLKKETA